MPRRRECFGLPADEFTCHDPDCPYQSDCALQSAGLRIVYAGVEPMPGWENETLPRRYRVKLALKPRVEE